MFSGTFWRKNHLLIPLCCWDMAWKLGWKFLKVVLLFLLQKLGRIFCPTLITKIVNIYISGSTQPFFTKQEPLDSQLDNKSFHYIIEMFSTTFRNSSESLLLLASHWTNRKQARDDINWAVVHMTDSCCLTGFKIITLKWEYAYASRPVYWVHALWPFNLCGGVSCMPTRIWCAPSQRKAIRSTSPQCVRAPPATDD